MQNQETEIFATPGIPRGHTLTWSGFRDAHQKVTRKGTSGLLSKRLSTSLDLLNFRKASQGPRRIVSEPRRGPKGSRGGATGRCLPDCCVSLVRFPFIPAEARHEHSPSRLHPPSGLPLRVRIIHLRQSGPLSGTCHPSQPSDTAVARRPSPPNTS